MLNCQKFTDRLGDFPKTMSQETELLLPFYVPSHTCTFSLVNSSSPYKADVRHVTISVTVFPMSSLMLVGTVLNLVMFTVIAFSGSHWVRGRDRVTEPFVWLLILDWNLSAVMLATCTPSMSTMYCSVG